MYGDEFVVCTNIKSLCQTLETNIKLYVNCMSEKNSLHIEKERVEENTLKC